MDNTTPDGELIKSYLTGDERAFTLLYSRYRQPLYGFLNRLSRNHADADDVFQECWIKVVSSLKNYRHDGKFGAWLFRIARNVYFDRLRSDRFHNALVSIDEPEAEEVPATDGNPAEVLENLELRLQLEEAVGEMAPELREVFSLRQKGVPFKKIAEIQRCSINTALGRMQYALKFLRARFRRD